MATSWTILGTNDRITYTSVDTETGQSWTTPTSATYSVSSPGAYKFYAIVVQTVAATAGTSTTSINKWELNCSYNTTISQQTNSFWSNTRASTSFSFVTVSPDRTAATDGGWSGCVLVPDGRVVIAPQIPTVGFMGTFSPITRTITQIAAGGIGTNYAYAGTGVLAPNGRVIFGPFKTTAIGIFNPVTNSFTTTTGGLTGNPGHSGSCLLPNGNILFAPYDSAWIGIFNPNTNVYTTGPTIAGYTTQALAGCVPLPDGRVVLCPQNGTTFGAYDYITNTYTVASGITVQANAYFGGCLLPDGRVAFTPYTVDNIGIYNPVTNSFTTVPTPGGIRCIGGGRLLPNGLVYFHPYNTTSYGIFNPVTNSVFSVSASGFGGAGSCQGSALLFDGRIISPPFVNTNRLGILTGSPIPVDRGFALHPLLNRG